MIDEVTNAEEKVYLESIKDRLKLKFLHYHEHKGISRSIGNAIVLRQSSKETLLKLYDSSTKTAKKLKSRIRATGRLLDSCPLLWGYFSSYVLGSLPASKNLL